jgi:hypothetical protein
MYNATTGYDCVCDVSTQGFGVCLDYAGVPAFMYTDNSKYYVCAYVFCVSDKDRCPRLLSDLMYVQESMINHTF